MILSGCATSGAPSVKEGFQLSRECEHLATNVDEPTVTLTTDPKLAVGEYKVALDGANTNLTATRTCQSNQRKRLSRRDRRGP
jgi:hypothetical protein